LNAGELSDLEKAYKKGKKEHDKVVAQLDESRVQFQKFEREDVAKREQKTHLKAQIKKASAAADKDARKVHSFLVYIYVYMYIYVYVYIYTYIYI